MHGLNVSFRRWVKEQQSENPTLSWEQGLREYLAFEGKLRRSGGVVEGAGASSSGAGRQHAPVALAAPAPAPAPLPAAAAAATARGGGVGGGGGFGFGGGGGDGGGSGGGFSFGAGAPAPAPAPAAASAPAGDVAEGEAGADGVIAANDGPSLVSEASADDAFAERASLRMFVLERKEWVEKGKGMLRIKKKANGATGSVCMNDGATGKLLLNAALYKGLEVEQMGKSGVALLLQNPADSTAGDLSKFLVRVKPENLGKLQSALKANIPQ
jgi:hypothetical protein